MSPTPPAVEAVLELFQGPLADVRFADVDAKGLASLAAQVEQAALAVQEQEAQLAALRLTLSERQEALLALAQRALSYARVYAENDEALLTRLNAISRPRVPKPRKNAKASQTGSDAVARTAETAGAEPSTESIPLEGENEAASSSAPVASRKGKRRSTLEVSA